MTRQLTQPMTRTSSLTGSLCMLAGLLLAVTPTGAIFNDSGWIAPAVAVIVLVVITGAVFRGLPGFAANGLTIAAQAVVTFLALPYLCAPGSLAAGLLPGPASYAAVATGVREGFAQIFSTTAPVATTAGFLTLLVIGVALVAMLADTLALDLRQEKAAALLVLAQLAVPALLPGTHIGWGLVAASAAGFVLVLLTRQALTRPFRMPSAALAAGFLAVVVAVAGPAVLPDVPDTHRATLGTGDLKVTNPFLDLRKDLADRSDDPLFEYTTDAKDPEPIRLTSVTMFDGRTWQPEDFTLNLRNSVTRGLPATQDIRAGKTTAAATKITVRDLTGSYLPAPYAPRTVRDAGDGWIFDPKTLTMVSHAGLSADHTYTVDSVTGAPSPEELRKAGAADDTRFSNELALPGSLPKSVTNTAKRITRGANDNWERAAKIQAYLRSDRFTYSLDAPAVASGNAIADFLKDKRGYCVQFSATMAVMSRYLGIPARIGVGYTPGTKNADGSYTVTSRDAHAWPELYFPDYGWTRFEPTPGGTAGTPPAWTGAPEESTPATTAPTSSAPAEPSEEPGDGEETTPAGGATSAAADEGTGGGQSDTDAVIPRWLWWAAGAALVLIAALLAPGLVRRAQCSRRLRSGGPEARKPQAPQPENQWTEFIALLIDYGQAPGPADTVSTTAARLREKCADPADAELIARLAAAVESARYGNTPQDMSARGTSAQGAGLTAAQAARARAAVRAGLRGESTTSGRLLADCFPPSLFRR